MEHYFTNNENLKSEIRVLKYHFNDTSFQFFSDNGLFAKDKIDYGSRLLVETFLKENDKKINKILDVGCGYGFLGIVLSKCLSSASDLIDVNKRAIHLALENISKNKVNATAYESNIYENVNGQYDLIITNPPIRAGKKIVLEILTKAKDYLSESGELWFVMRKDQGVKSTINALQSAYKLEIMTKSKGFYVVRAKIC